MRLYGKKNIRRLVDKRSSKRQEMRDAILWDVSGQTGRIKIQGSNELIIAHFPRNQRETPVWMRGGNAVRVVHKNGVRGYVEIVGEGRSIPTPVSGGSFPDIGTISDGILSGLVVTSTTVPSTNVEVSAGTYRIDGVIYLMDEVTGGYIVMDDPAPMVMGDLPFVLNGQVSYDLGASPAAGYFRYDIIVAGTDGNLNLINGDEVTSDPVMPAVPVDHILVDFVLRVGGEETILMGRIGELYETSYAVSLDMPEDLELSWSFVIDDPTINFTVTVKDQYGNSISSSDGWVMTLTKLFGTGEVWSLQSGWDEDEVSQNLISENTYTFVYRRDQTASPEYRPYIQVAVTGGRSTLLGFEGITLLDDSGEPISMEE